MHKYSFLSRIINRLHPTSSGKVWIYDSSKVLVIELPTELKVKIPKAGQLAYGFNIEV